MCVENQLTSAWHYFGDVSTTKLVEKVINALVERGVPTVEIKHYRIATGMPFVVQRNSPNAFVLSYARYQSAFRYLLLIILIPSFDMSPI